MERELVKDFIIMMRWKCVHFLDWLRRRVVCKITQGTHQICIRGNHEAPECSNEVSFLQNHHNNNVMHTASSRHVTDSVSILIPLSLST